MRVILQTFAILMLVILTILAIFARIAYISCHDVEVMSWDDWDWMMWFCQVFCLVKACASEMLVLQLLQQLQSFTISRSICMYTDGHKVRTFFGKKNEIYTSGRVLTHMS